VEGLAGSDEVPGAGNEEDGELEMKNGRLWLTVISVFIALYAAMTIFAVVAPLFVIHSITGHTWLASFNIYASDFSRTQQVDANWIRWGFVDSFAVSVILFVAAVGLGFKFPAAQITLVLLGAISLCTILVSNVWGALSVGLLSSLRGLDTILFWTATVTFLSLPSSRTLLGLGPWRAKTSSESCGDGER
jgi:hypothetical protein